MGALSPEEIRRYLDQAEDIEKTRRLKKRLAHLRQERQPFYLTRDEVEEILRWKWRRQFGRNIGRFRRNPEEVVRGVTRLALGPMGPVDPEDERDLRLRLLCVLFGIDVPTASAILALCFPERYAVIDRWVWQELFGEEKSSFNPGDYRRYLECLRPLAENLGRPIQEVEHAVWERARRKREKRKDRTFLPEPVEPRDSGEERC